MLSTSNWAAPTKTALQEQYRTELYDTSARLSRAKFVIELAVQLLFDLQQPLSGETHSRHTRLFEGHIRRYANIKIREGAA